MTGPTGIFSKFERDELNKITAKAILEKLMNIRQNINVEFTARRLIWELMQNAKDNASLCNKEGENVDVTIQLTQDKFIFSHNKGYFTNEHIRGLIRKYSSSDKNRDDGQIGQLYKTTGRFGTGFMTTHLLSENVKVESYYKNDDHTFNQFNFWLDRSGKTELKIIEGINNAFDEAEANIQRANNVILTKNDFRTSFIYPLTSHKRELANITFEEVKKGVGYTLLNVQEISSVNIVDSSLGDIIYKIELIDTIPYRENNFSIHNLLVDGKKSKSYFISIKDNELQIILPVTIHDDKYYILELESTIPRLHLDFPMTGTEDLNLPFIVNSPLFEPTEPRDGVSLINDEDNEILKMNCSILLRAVNLYNLFLSYVSEKDNWFDLYNLSRIKLPKKHNWIEQDWFKLNIVDTIRLHLLHSRLVDVVNTNRISIWDESNENVVYFPYHQDDLIREKLWELSKEMYPNLVPIKEHVNHWNKIIWDACYKFSLSELSKKIQEQENLDVLADTIYGERREAIAFLNNYYNLLNLEENHIKDINTDKYKVIPNQLGVFKKKTELYLDKGIDNELKNACAIISGDPRQYLIHKNAFTGEGILYGSKKPEDIIVEINNIIKESANEDAVSSVCDYLASLFPEQNSSEKRRLIFEFSQRIFPSDFTIERKLKYYDERIWEESDKKSLFYIVLKISEYKTVDKVCEELNFADQTDFYKWLDEFVTFLVKEGFQNNINREKHPILPNQNGFFCTKDKLFLDAGDIDEELKDISKELGYDFRDELLIISIFLELPENRTHTIENVAEKISSFIKPILRDVDKRKEYKDTLKKFYLWMNKNRENANIYFSDLFEKRFLFLEDDDISLNIKKANEFEQIMQEHGIESIDDLRNKLSKLNTQNNNYNENEKIHITKEILVSLGISSQDQLEEAFKNPSIAARFYHTSTPTPEMYAYAQQLIVRAKNNIIQFLNDHPDYDCTEMEETAQTTFVGIVKNGVSIQIVTRPSDNGEVIVYYSSEKDTLDSDNSELWVDNAISDPHILTLGRILKSTGINRIPINMN